MLWRSIAIGRIGLEAVADMANLNLLGVVAHGTGCVLNERFLLLVVHQSEEHPRLRERIVILWVVIGDTVERQRWFTKAGLLLPSP